MYKRQLEYDSRLFMGKDIFSSSEGFVLFKDKDWISEKGKRSELIASDEAYAEKMADIHKRLLSESLL